MSTDTITKTLTELVAGDVIVDRQGARSTVSKVVAEHGEADEWEDAYDGFRIFTDREPSGRLIVPVGHPDTVKFDVEMQSLVIGDKVGQYLESGISGYYHRIDIVKGDMTFFAVHPSAKLVGSKLVAIDAAEGEQAFLTGGRKKR